MRKVNAWLMVFALLAALCLPQAAHMEEYPKRKGVVTDLADSIGTAAIADIETLGERYHVASGGTLSVVTRHFLGGADTQEYAQALFDAWALDAGSALLLMVVGEDSYALCLGESARSVLPKETANALLSNHFRAAFMAREYDTALAAFLPALAKKLDDGVSTVGLFGEAAIVSTPEPAVDVKDSDWAGFFSDSWANWNKDDNEHEEEDPDWIRTEEKETGFSFGRLVVIGLILYFVFGKKKKGRGGCGCGPLGWILGTLGIADLFGLRKR